jgi:signal transduction histidine kinase
MKPTWRLLLLDTLFGRIAGLLIVNLVLVQTVTAFFVQVELEHAPARSELTERIATSLRALDALPAEQRPALAEAIAMPDLDIQIRSTAEVKAEHPDGLPVTERLDPRFAERLHERLGGKRLRHDIQFWRPSSIPTMGIEAGEEPLVIAISLHDGGYAEFHPQRIPTAFRWLQLATLIGSTVVVSSALSLWFARRLSRGLARFADAAEELGRSTEAPPLPERGPIELARATSAFNRMQERLRRFVQDRTQMVASISHDLRTPLTRMRLRAEFVEDEDQRAKMLHDIGEMETMIAETLAFARDDAVREARQVEDLDEMLDLLCQALREAGHHADYTAIGPVSIRCAPTALRRAFANLIENGAKYGQRARVQLRQEGGQIIVDIDDDGPGIDEDLRETVFQPFFRLESSRNRDTGGVGLGLSLSRTIIRSHGGDINLANRAEGGLRATVTLPA